MSAHKPGSKPARSPQIKNAASDGAKMTDDERVKARRKEIIASVLILAERDVHAAKLLADGKNYFGAYHCQQAAEKLVKAFLQHHNIEPGRSDTHNIGSLVDKLPESEAWRAVLKPLDKYSQYATTYRYPAPGGRISPEPDPSEVTAGADALAVLIKKARSLLVGS